VRAVRLLSPLAAASIALAGCGSESEPQETSTSTTTAATAEASVTPQRERLEDELRRLLRAGGAVDVDCAIESLRGTLSNELLEQAVAAADRGEEIPQEAADAAYAAGQACGAP